MKRKESGSRPSRTKFPPTAESEKMTKSRDQDRLDLEQEQKRGSSQLQRDRRGGVYWARGGSGGLLSQ
jgi:hypothetical protein